MHMNPQPAWKAGDVVVLRGVWRSKFWWACPAIVVQDQPELMALYWRAGTPVMNTDKRPVPQDLLTNEIQLCPQHWTSTDVLALVVPGEAHAIYLMWETGQNILRCWYVDLHEPYRRTATGFDTMDHLLDIVISPDLSKWKWKDEDEFEQAIAIGVYSPQEARAFAPKANG